MIIELYSTLIFRYTYMCHFRYMAYIVEYRWNTIIEYFRASKSFFNENRIWCAWERDFLRSFTLLRTQSLFTINSTPLKCFPMFVMFLIHYFFPFISRNTQTLSNSSTYMYILFYIRSYKINRVDKFFSCYFILIEQ